MMASKLIEKLQRIVAEHGDQPVHMLGHKDEVNYTPGLVAVYDEYGNTPGDDRPAVEIYMHLKET